MSAGVRATPSPNPSPSDAAPEPNPGISPTSFGSENESLGINQRAALRELRRLECCEYSCDHQPCTGNKPHHAPTRFPEMDAKTKTRTAVGMTGHQC